MNSLLLPLLNESEGLGLDPAGADAPEVDRELAGHGNDCILSRRACGEGAFGCAIFERSS